MKTQEEIKETVKEILLEQLQLLRQESRRESANIAELSVAMEKIASQLCLWL